MPYISTFDRTQMMLCNWDSFVDEESDARVIDAFVNSLDMEELGIKEAAEVGRPSYDPRGLLKLYIYGHRNGIRSSRKLAKSCQVNMEVKWMIGGVEPDFRTISDFRKINISGMKKVFREFNRRLTGIVEWGFNSVDGSKFLACNSKDNNFTKNKLDDRIKWLDDHCEEYLRILDEMDRQDENGNKEPDVLTREIVETKLAEAKERLERYQGYQKLMEKKGLTQLSLVDPDAKLMKSKNGFEVAYNPQTSVDSNTHLIRDYEMTNRVTDHGLLYDTIKEVKAASPEKIIEVVADRGYEKAEDMIECLENGIIPHVITDDGKDGYELEISYKEEPDVDVTSTNADEIKKCLHAGIVPEVYKDVITKTEVREVRRWVSEGDKTEALEISSIYGDEEAMIARARKGYFVRDPERNLVYCPNGEALRQKSIKSNGNIRYANKNACRHCKYRNKCYKGKNEWKEIDFTKDCLEKPCKAWLKAEGKENPLPTKKRKGHYETKMIVQLFLKPSIEKMTQRMCLSEHPFGTLKRTLQSGYFLLKGMEKVEGEFALFCIAYNIKRAINLLGFHKMMEVMAGAGGSFLLKMCVLFSFQ